MLQIRVIYLFIYLFISQRAGAHRRPEPRWREEWTGIGLLGRTTRVGSGQGGREAPSHGIRELSEEGGQQGQDPQGWEGPTAPEGGGSAILSSGGRSGEGSGAEGRRGPGKQSLSGWSRFLLDAARWKNTHLGPYRTPSSM